MHFAESGCGVPVCIQMRGEGRDPGVQNRTEMWVSAREHRHPARSAQRHLAIGSFEVDALVDEPVEAGGATGLATALRTARREESEAVLVTEEEKNVGSVNHSRYLCEMRDAHMSQTGHYDEFGSVGQGSAKSRVTDSCFPSVLTCDSCFLNIGPAHERNAIGTGQ